MSPVEPHKVRSLFSIPRRAIVAITGPWTKGNALTWLALILGVLTIRWLLFEPYKIPTGSMEPTLHGDMRFFRGDRIGANKLVYGPRVPFTNMRIFHIAEPKRWEIVVFRTVQESAVHKTLVKRIVGLPGERIHIQDGKIWVNGKPVEPPEPLRGILYYTSAFTATEEQLDRFILYMARAGSKALEGAPQNYAIRKLAGELEQVQIRLGGRDPERVSAEETNAIARELSPVSRELVDQFLRAQQDAQYPLRYGILPDDEYSLVPDNCYLVCGDNSADSADGRVFGWLPNDHILGRAFCIWCPPSRVRDLTGFSKTWWGMALLYGIPTLFVVCEAAGWIRRRRRTGPAH